MGSHFWSPESQIWSAFNRLPSKTQLTYFKQKINMIELDFICLHKLCTLDYKKIYLWLCDDTTWGNVVFYSISFKYSVFNFFFFHFDKSVTVNIGICKISSALVVSSKCKLFGKRINNLNIFKSHWQMPSILYTFQVTLILKVVSQKWFRAWFIHL